MELVDLDIKILKALYELKFNYGKKLDFKEMGFENNQHGAYHLFRLHNLGYINFNEREVFNTGGRNHEKYNNNVLMIWSEKIDLLEKGIKEIEKLSSMREKIKFPEQPRWGANDNINDIQGLIDFVTDEYGNYYTPYKTTTENGKLLKVTLVHVLYDEAFSTIFLQDEIEKDYKYSHLGEMLLDRMNSHIEELNREKREIFTVQDLIVNETEVSFWDITHYKTQSKGK